MVPAVGFTSSTILLPLLVIKYLQYLILLMFSAYTSSGPAAQNDFMDTDDLIDVDASVPAHSLLSAAQNLNPFSLINSNFGQRFFDGGASEFSNRVPQVSHPREVREVPIEFKDGNSRHGSSSHGPTIEEVTGSIPAHGPEVDGHVIIDDEDEDLPSAPTDQPDEFDDISRGRRPGPNFTPLSNVSDYGNDIEEEMIRAAIEASKRDTMASASQQLDFPNVICLPLMHYATISLSTWLIFLF